MLFHVASHLEYAAKFPSTLILNIHAQRSASQVILEEQFSVEPRVKIAEFTAEGTGNRFLRLETGRHKKLTVGYSASVECDFQTYRAGAVEPTPIADLSAASIPYLFPSRYCQSDRLSRLAWDLFGKIENPHEKVVAISDWIHENVEYLRGSTTSVTSAYDTVTQRTGRLPGLFTPGDRALSRVEHPGALLLGLCLRARSAGLPRLFRMPDRGQLDGVRRHPPRALERPGADWHRPRRRRRRRRQHLRQRDVHEESRSAANSARGRSSSRSIASSCSAVASRSSRKRNRGRQPCDCKYSTSRATPINGPSRCIVIGSCCVRGRATTCAWSGCTWSWCRRTTCNGFATSSATPSRSSTGWSLPILCASSATSCSNGCRHSRRETCTSRGGCRFRRATIRSKPAIVAVYSEPTYAEDVATVQEWLRAVARGRPARRGRRDARVVPARLHHRAVPPPHGRRACRRQRRRSPLAADRVATWRRC